MNLLVARVYAVLIAALAVIGLFVHVHLFNIMNTDIALDLLRVVLAAFLIYVGFVAKDGRLASKALLFVGGLYVIMGLVGVFSSTLGGLLPSGLTGFDIAFHLVTGLAALAVGMRKDQAAPARA